MPAVGNAGHAVPMPLPAEPARTTDLAPAQGSAALRAELDVNRAIFAHSRDLLCTVESDGRVSRISDSATQILGYAAHELVDRPLLSLVDPRDRARTRALARQLFAGKPTSAFENRMLRKDGSSVSVLWSAVWVAEHGWMCCVGRDLTERMRDEEAVRQAQKREAIGRLAGGLAHDFNNLLTIILGNTDVLVDQLADQPRERALVELTRDAAQRGADLTRRLLMIARQQTTRREVVDVGALVHGMVSLLRRTLGADIELVLERSDDLWSSYLDASELESAVLNLCVNARDAMPEGGRLRVVLRNLTVEPDYAESGFAAAQDRLAPGDYVQIAVADTGTGMAPEVMRRACDPFYTTKAAGKGTGLGLAMVYAFAKQSGGNVTLRSRPGEGTEVRVQLPGVEALPAPDVVAPGKPAEAPQGGNEHVLLVEDDDMVRGFAVHLVRALGYQVTEAASASEALAHVDAGRNFDLLFTDVVMPGGMNGLQLAAAVRERHPDLPVLFTSGYTDNQVFHHGRADQGVLLVHKPYRRAKLAQMLRATLAQCTALPQGRS